VPLTLTITLCAEILRGHSAFGGLQTQVLFSRIAPFRACSALFSFKFGFPSSLDQLPEVFDASMIFGVWLFALWIALLELFDAVILFELWILVPRIILFWPAASSYYSGFGLRSLELFSFGQQRRHIIWVVDFDPSNYSLGQQRHHIIQVVDFDPLNRSLSASGAIVLFVS
jgi:hypothetical protein